MDGLSEIFVTALALVASAGGLRALLSAFGIQRKEAARIRALRLLQNRQVEIAEQLLASRDLLDDVAIAARQQDEPSSSHLDATSIRSQVSHLKAELVTLTAGIETKQAHQEKDNNDPKIARRSKRARWIVLIALFLPILVDLAIILVGVPVALRWVSGWTLPSAIHVVFPAASGSGWAALIVSFFVPHVIATAVLGRWAWKVRHLDSEKYAKATETARSVAGGYVALVALVLCINLVGLANVGWYEGFSDSLRELTKPMLPLLSVAAFVAAFGPGYSKYMEGMAELEKSTAPDEEADAGAGAPETLQHPDGAVLR